MKPETFASRSFISGFGSMSGKSERRNASVRSGTLKSAGGAALGICGETVVGLLFWAREYRAPMKGTHRSNPRKSALERLRYLSRFVTSREKPYLDGSLRRIIQESRMMRAFAEASRSHRSVICVYQRISFVTTENFGAIRGFSNDDKSGKVSEIQTFEQACKWVS